MLLRLVLFLLLWAAIVPASTNETVSSIEVVLLEALEMASDAVAAGDSIEPIIKGPIFKHLFNHVKAGSSAPSFSKDLTKRLNSFMNTCLSFLWKSDGSWLQSYDPDVIFNFIVVLISGLGSYGTEEMLGFFRSLRQESMKKNSLRESFWSDVLKEAVQVATRNEFRFIPPFSLRTCVSFAQIDEHLEALYARIFATDENTSTDWCYLHLVLRPSVQYRSIGRHSDRFIRIFLCHFDKLMFMPEKFAPDLESFLNMILVTGDTETVAVLFERTVVEWYVQLQMRLNSGKMDYNFDNAFLANIITRKMSGKSEKMKSLSESSVSFIKFLEIGACTGFFAEDLLKAMTMNRYELVLSDLGKSLKSIYASTDYPVCLSPLYVNILQREIATLVDRVYCSLSEYLEKIDWSNMVAAVCNVRLNRLYWRYECKTALGTKAFRLMESCTRYLYSIERLQRKQNDPCSSTAHCRENFDKLLGEIPREELLSAASHVFTHFDTAGVFAQSYIDLIAIFENLYSASDYKEPILELARIFMKKSGLKMQQYIVFSHYVPSEFRALVHIQFITSLMVQSKSTNSAMFQSAEFIDYINWLCKNSILPGTVLKIATSTWLHA